MSGMSSVSAFFPYAAETDGVVVRASVSYHPDGSEPEQGRWFWAYHIRIENHSQREIQLLTRRWVITDGHGMQNIVEGEGVIGETPRLGPGESFDYVSGCPLVTPHGTMEGFFGMVDEDGNAFAAAVPLFPLLAPVEAR